MDFIKTCIKAPSVHQLRLTQGEPQSPAGSTVHRWPLEGPVLREVMEEAGRRHSSTEVSDWCERGSDNSSTWVSRFGGVEPLHPKGI